ncbi:MAG: hypothetical protein LBU65_00135 [Planctomycetaceae bacterium]|nr:hypothetical protein [Planctomycetaceae bacterium]
MEKTTGRKDGCHLRRNILETMELLLEKIKIPTLSFTHPGGDEKKLMLLTEKPNEVKWLYWFVENKQL